MGLMRRPEAERLGRRTLPLRRSCAAAAMAAREGVTPRIDADDPVRGMLRPSRFSTGGSSLAAFHRRSSLRAKLNEALRLDSDSLTSDSSSLESLSNKPGYRSRMDLVGDSSAGLVSVRAMPFSSIVKITDARFLGLCSEMDPSGVRPTLFNGEAVLGMAMLVLRSRGSEAMLMADCAVPERTLPVVLLRRS